MVLTQNKCVLHLEDVTDPMAFRGPSQDLLFIVVIAWTQAVLSGPSHRAGLRPECVAQICLAGEE